jgi:hypothetical protein
MSLLVVALLAALWAAVLLPAAVRGRRHNSPMNQIDSFERSMVMLAHRAQSRPGPGRQVLMPPPPRRSARARAARRRRMVLTRLSGAAAATGLLAVIAGGLVWLLFALVAAALGGYLVMLFRLEARQVEARRKVRPLHEPQRQPLDLHELAVADQGGSG